MTLNYDITKIAMYKDNYDEAYQEYTQFGSTYRDVKPFLKGLIFSGGMVALSSITFKNVGEWYARLKLCEEMYKTYLISKYDEDQKEYVDVPLEAKELAKYIGLSTNHSTATRSQWTKNVKRNQSVDLTTTQMIARLKKLEEKFEREVFQ
ncbi:hypothetical protein UFOVP573_26 [uncultured Caudovirales phage]|uniref:Uncharacterized protein n=1 Tax=uncultured Caudovirales phage TaxID=2100421 RepID=A0A6J5RBV2_9CAUD|nr:hypothetical protein UFOVP288_89 [uncultured Caudovirales phage]CAB4146145.1 hypothetical protein UFOVP483_107 [uncultured Caudovirales phage]CAB4150718.1 hypothetical protein UFOVP573_26 [uncultured Caudovirales phage]CAB4161575.1 hypothetical protein UFOVP769_89 [uncultured Caudovirales phage]CAB4174516.1 hypothetical protein UFOVP962_57 [uncultured Caudovirales phage]